ncbi:MAG: hypothetical protein JRI23_27820, partial [Deltaproteobacteria bacterium]|nr:hypothetical protein [Deltaproteobacteria bacterium]MBW2535899.1 hypothetical protein [Deltaproteobacteria bacterium]
MMAWRARCAVMVGLLWSATPGCGADEPGGQATTAATTGPGGSTGTGTGAAGGAGTATTSSAGAGGGAGGSSTPPEVAAARCGLDYDWLPASAVGDVVSSETPHSTLTVAEALVAKVALASEGLDLGRIPAFETLAHRVVYTTQDRGQLREATTLVVVPQVAQAQSFPVLLFHHGTTGLNDTCAPTYGLEDSSSEAFAVALLLSL